MGRFGFRRDLLGDVRPTLRLNPSNQTVAEYVTVPADVFRLVEPVGDLGGPILRDRIWFHGGYNRRSTRTERTVTFRSNQVRDTFVSDPLDNIVHSNVSSQLTQSLRGRFVAANQRSRGGRTLPGIEADGTSTSNPALFPSPTRTDTFNDSYSTVFDWVASNRTYANMTVTYFQYGSKEVGNFSNELRHTFQGSNFQFADIPADLKKVNGFADNPSTSRLVKDDLSRLNINGDITRYTRWRGEHAVKAGVQFERVATEVIRGAQAPEIQLFWDAELATNDGRRVRGPYGYYNVTRGVITEGDIHAQNVGLFVQDAWTVHDRLTLNLGIRAENEEIPSYRPENPGVEFGFADKIAPRVGFAWDVKGNSSLKAYGSWGVFYDLMKLTIGRVMFGAERWMNYRFTLDSFDWPSIQCGYPPVSGPSCPGTFIESFDFRPVANDPGFNVVDPDLKPIRSQEFTVGVDHELSKTMSLGVRYAHKWVDRAIEAVCFFGGESGLPRSTVINQRNIGFFPYGRGDMGRMPAFSQTALLVQQQVRLRKTGDRVVRRQCAESVRSEDRDRLQRHTVPGSVEPE